MDQNPSQPARIPTDWEKLSLWKNQQYAVSRCLAYLKQPDRSALVQMPTGTGKTGIIAVLSALQSSKGAVLVVSPSRPLADQLFSDISGKFWEKIEANNWNPKKTVSVLPSEAKQLVEELKQESVGVVLISTFQALSQIRRDNQDYYDEIAKVLNLVLVDEGHREPSRDWGTTIRKLGQPTVLFTATPYRNDLKIFDVSPSHVAYLSFVEGVERKLIRDVDYSLAQASSDAALFVRDVIKAYDDLKTRQRLAADARVIVRCADEDRVRRLHDLFTEQLQNRPERCRAIHHQFEDEEDTSLTSIAAIRNSDETFLIHQFKLMEGLDDPRCAMLALYDGFGSDRQFVQQLGRVLRNPRPSEPTTPAFVIATDKQGAIDTWNRYKRFDHACYDHGGNPFLRNENFVNELLDQLPAEDYIFGRFRKRADFQNANVSDELLIPQSAIIYRLSPSFQFDSLERIIRETLVDEDRYLIQAYHLPDRKCSAYFSVLTAQSPLLAESSFPDLTLAVTVVKQAQNLLFFYDSAGLWIDENLDNSDRLSSARLYCLFPGGLDVRISSLSVKNADMSRFAVRSRTVSASSIAEAVPFMGDNTNFISRASGSTPDSKRRYVGFTRARVRDDQAAAVTIGQFSDWAEAVAGEINKQAKSIQLFSRFAMPTEPPAEPAPRNILLDVEDFADQFVYGQTPLKVEDVCCEVEERDPDKTSGKYAHQFHTTINGEKRRVLIRYDHKRHRYVLKSRALNQFVYKDNPKITLTTRLNRRQAFRVVPEEPGIFYAYRQFYNIELKLSDHAMRSFVLDFLKPISDLDTIASEKGNQTGAVSVWQKGSLFAFLDEGLAGKQGHAIALKPFKAIVCDDMGTECADFVALEPEENRAVFVHAKAVSDTPGVSASKLHDVCSQAVKNLEFIRFGGSPLAGRRKKWSRPWKAASKKDKLQCDPGYEVSPRIRRGPKDADKFISLFANILAQPNSRREVWIVLGGILSKSAFEQNLSKKNPDGYALQTFFLLASTFSACKSVGVDLQVFCSK